MYHCLTVYVCLVPRLYVIYFILQWHDIAYLCWKCRYTPIKQTKLTFSALTLLVGKVIQPIRNPTAAVPRDFHRETFKVAMEKCQLNTSQCCVCVCWYDRRSSWRASWRRCRTNVERPSLREIHCRRKWSCCGPRSRSGKPGRITWSNSATNLIRRNIREPCKLATAGCFLLLQLVWHGLGLLMHNHIILVNAWLLCVWCGLIHSAHWEIWGEPLCRPCDEQLAKHVLFAPISFFMSAVYRSYHDWLCLEWGTKRPDWLTTRDKVQPWTHKYQPLMVSVT